MSPAAKGKRQKSFSSSFLYAAHRYLVARTPVSARELDRGREEIACERGMG